MTFELVTKAGATKAELYSSLADQLRSLLEGERDVVANMANFASLLFYSSPDLNWTGFYLLKERQLVLGPFQGKPACIRIPVGEGVCGTAAARRETILVQNVHEFPGHIACDSASNSEIVVPIVAGEELIGVLDLDSPLLSRFDEDDAKGLNELIKIFIAATDLGQAGQHHDYNSPSGCTWALRLSLVEYLSHFFLWRLLRSLIYGLSQSARYQRRLRPRRTWLSQRWPPRHGDHYLHS